MNEGEKNEFYRFNVWHVRVIKRGSDNDTAEVVKLMSFPDEMILARAMWPHYAEAICSEHNTALAKALFPQNPSKVCDTTSTQRFVNPKCKCPTYPGNLGPCDTWSAEGSNGRCPYCDHTEECHKQLQEMKAIHPVEECKTEMTPPKSHVVEEAEKLVKRIENDEIRSVLENIISYLRLLELDRDTANAKVKELETIKDGAYRERNKVVALLSKCFPSSLERHPDSDTQWENDWRWIVFVDLPTGQATWHIHDSEMHLFDHLSRETGKVWDGHSFDEKYGRVCRVGNNALTAKLAAVEKERDAQIDISNLMFAQAKAANSERDALQRKLDGAVKGYQVCDDCGVKPDVCQNYYLSEREAQRVVNNLLMYIKPTPKAWIQTLLIISAEPPTQETP